MYLNPPRRSLGRLSGEIAIALAVLYVAATGVRIYARRYDVFLAAYLRHSIDPTPTLHRPTHILFLFVDHFEPDWSVERAQEWADRYRALAARHRDSQGRRPQHTWAYPGEQIDDRILTILRRLTEDGLGEVEMHYHHDSDTAQTLQVGLRS